MPEKNDGAADDVLALLQTAEAAPAEAHLDRWVLSDEVPRLGCPAARRAPSQPAWNPRRWGRSRRFFRFRRGRFAGCRRQGGWDNATAQKAADRVADLGRTLDRGGVCARFHNV